MAGVTFVGTLGAGVGELSTLGSNAAYSDTLGAGAGGTGDGGIDTIGVCVDSVGVLGTVGGIAGGEGSTGGGEGKARFSRVAICFIAFCVSLPKERAGMVGFGSFSNAIMSPTDCRR